VEAVTDPSLCRRCFRPTATEEQWGDASLVADAGSHLCFGEYANCEDRRDARISELEQQRDRAVTLLRQLAIGYEMRADDDCLSAAVLEFVAEASRS